MKNTYEGVRKYCCRSAAWTKNLKLKFNFVTGVRCVVRNFRGQGRFLKVRAQILNSSEELIYMQTLPRASLKNNHPYQILITLVSILNRAYDFMIRESKEALTFLLGKIQDIIFSSYTIYWTRNSSSNEPKNMLFWNASTKAETQGEHLAT